MDKKIVMLGMLVGSTIGGYIPTFWGASVFSMSSVICGGIGGIFGIWLSYKFIN